MSIFKRKKEEEYDEEEDLEVKDLKPENRRKRKEPPKPWGKRERYTVLIFLLTTVLASAILAASSRNWKLPGLPQLKLPSIPKWNFNFLSGETITIGPGAKGINPLLIEKENTIKDGFRKMTGNFSGTYSFYVVDLESGYGFGENEEETLTAASLIKLPVIAAIYIESEEGNLDLDESPEGSTFSFRQMAEEMGKRSNNQVQLAAVNALGREEIKLVINRIGMVDTSYAENETTAYDIGIFFQKLWNKEIVSEKSRDEILGYLTDTIYEDWLKKGISEVQVAHKYGREVHVVSDAGIVFDESPFVLVVMTQGIIEKEADVFIPEFASLVFREM